MARKKKTLEKWMDECLSDNSMDAQLNQFSLIHMQGTRPVEIYKFSKLRTEPPPNMKEVAELFQDKAETHAQALQGLQTFNVWAFYGSNKDDKQYYVFTVSPGEDVNQGHLTTEAPTEQGMRQQEMRWNEANRMQVYQRQAELDRYSLELIRMQGQEIMALQRERFDNGNMVMELIGKQHDRAHIHRITELEHERTNKLIEQGVKLLPAVINTATNKEIFPQSTEDSGIIETIIDALIANATNAEDLQMKANGMFAMFQIPPVMQGILMARINKGLQTRQEEAEAKARAQNLGLTKVSQKDAEADVAGGDIDVVDINSRRKAGG